MSGCTTEEQNLEEVTRKKNWKICLKKELCSATMAACVLASINLIAACGPLSQPLSLLQYDKIYWHVQMDNLVYSL